MITVELEPEEMYFLLQHLRRHLQDIANKDYRVSDMKAMLARIEYLEGLK